MDIAAMITKLFVKNGMIFGFMLLGIIMYISFKLGTLTMAVPSPFFWGLSSHTSAVK